MVSVPNIHHRCLRLGASLQLLCDAKARKVMDRWWRRTIAKINATETTRKRIEHRGKARTGVFSYGVNMMTIG
jgi:hypothetical protein